MLLRCYGPFPTPAKVKRHQEMKIDIGVRGEGERREAWFLDLYAQLFAKLSDKRLFGSLSGLYFASGKFP